VEHRWWEYVTENEILYLLICLKIGEIIKVPNMRHDYQSLRYKLLNILEEDTKEHYMEILERINFNIDYIILGQYRNDIKDVVLQSFYEYKDIIIRYHRPRKNETFTTRITPYILSYSSGGWYIYGYCHLACEDRFFRIDRIMDIKLSEETHDKSLIYNYLKGVNKEDNYVHVVLEIEKSLYETLKNDRIFIDSSVMEHENMVEVKLKTDEKFKIMEIATRNYQKVRVIEPQFIIDELKEMSRKILERY
jgi:predicted DNA-binding transcriptional regulator YafY